MEKTLSIIRRNLLYISSLLIVIGSFIDIVTLVNDNHTLIVNGITIGVITIAVVLFLFKIISIKVSFSVIVYTTTLNFIVSSFFEIHKTFYTNNFILSVLYLSMMISLIGFVVNKRHAVIVCGIFLVYFTIVLITTKDSFLMDRAAMLYILLPGYTVLIYHLMLLLEGAYENQLKLINQISFKNKEINTKNKTLTEREYKLKDLTDELSKKNTSLNQLNLSKDKLFSIIGHDLKNHTNTLNGFLTLLLERYDRLNAETAKKYIRLAKDSGDSLHTLLSDLLEWSRNQAEKPLFKPEKFDIYELVKNVIYYLKLNADLKEISIINTVPEKSFVYADHKMIFTILRNLVSNAIKFSFHKNSISILSITEKDKICIHIIDSGIGIPETKLKTLFSLDNTSSTPGTDSEQGSGLGLILCKQFAEENKGKIGVSSKENKGSDFWISLPLFNR